jgi:hypothetical protein
MNAPPAVQAFQHRQAAHCESGVASALLCHHGVPCSEPMAFGLSSALAFAFLPIIEVSGMPLIGYRMPPGWVLRGLKRVLRVPLAIERFRDPVRGMRRLDELLAGGALVGMQASVFHLPFFPPAMRFHFNAHNLLAFGRDGTDYLISDPVFETPQRCAADALERARFARGTLAPRGKLYHVAGRVAPVEPAAQARAAVRRTCRGMLYAPLPQVGVRGIRHLGRRLLALAQRRDEAYLRHLAGHIVRMQEEIGTGGAGFRFMYAAFLQEAAAAGAPAAYAAHANELNAIGDEWRDFAVVAARMARGRSPLDLRVLNELLLALYQRERDFFRSLAAV